MRGKKCITSSLRDRHFLSSWQLDHLHAKHTPQLHLRGVEYRTELTSSMRTKDFLANIGASNRTPLVLTGEYKADHFLHQLTKTTFRVFAARIIAVGIVAVVFVISIVNATPLSCWLGG